MRKCKYCDKESIVGVGKDNVPVCEEHFEKFLQGYGKLIAKVNSMTADDGIGIHPTFKK